MGAESPEPPVDSINSQLDTCLALLEVDGAWCNRYATTLSAWALFWRSTIITLGALVAAQGAFTKVWGNTDWLTLLFVVFGVLTVAGGGFEAAFKPSERSPKFAEIGDAYARLARDTRLADYELVRAAESTDGPRIDLEEQRAKLLRSVNISFDALRDKERILYVTGPTMFGHRRKAHQRGG